MKVGFVTQRYGLEVCGGAELLCRQVAEHMAKHWEVEAFTTCAVDYTTWENLYAPGEDEVNGVRVQRFPVTEWRTRRIPEFAHLCERMDVPGHTREEELRWMRLLGPWAPGLFDALEAKRTEYDLFIFFTYLYCSTYHGLPRVADRALLVPTAHDEPSLRVGLFRDLFHQPRGLIFLTPEEQALVHRRFGNQDIVSGVTGIGIEPPRAPDPDEFRRRHGISGPFALYVGRADPNKGCDQLFQHFLKYRERTPSPLDLVLMGQEAMPIPAHPGLRSLGFVSDEDKLAAMAAAEVLIAPSPYESLSIVILEAWAMGTPVLVNGRCNVLVGQCRRSQGGLWYTSAAEFATALDYLRSHRALRQRLARNGARYVEENYSWPAIESKYRQIAAAAVPHLVERV